MGWCRFLKTSVHREPFTTWCSRKPKHVWSVSTPVNSPRSNLYPWLPLDFLPKDRTSEWKPRVLRPSTRVSTVRLHTSSGETPLVVGLLSTGKMGGGFRSRGEWTRNDYGFLVFQDGSVLTRSQNLYFPVDLKEPLSVILLSIPVSVICLKPRWTSFVSLTGVNKR